MPELWRHYAETTMRKTFLLLLLALLPASAFAQRVECVVFTPATVAKMNANNIPVSTGLVEYMTATELAAAMTRALHCEIPRPQSVHDIDTAIAWRVLKFARSSEQLNRMFMAYCASYGQNTITSEVAIKWLTHNNFVARFNVWDAADVKHNWEAFKLPQKGVGTEHSVEDHPKTASSRAISTKTYVVIGSVDLIRPADKNCEGTNCWWEIDGTHGAGMADGWVVYASPKPNLQVGKVACVKAQFPLKGDTSFLSNEAIAAHYPRLMSYRVVSPDTPMGIYEASGPKDSCSAPTAQ